MNHMLNIMKREARQAQAGVSMRIGIVQGYDPDKYAAKVLIQPENVLTGALPISSEWVGNGWGIFCPPSDGDTVLVEFQEGDFESGIITKRLFHDAARPLTVQPGEFWLVHKSGSLMKFHNDGSVELTSNGNLTATVGGALTATVTGAAKITAASVELNGGGTAKGIVQADCVCAFTGNPHAMVSATVKGTI